MEDGLWASHGGGGSDGGGGTERPPPPHADEHARTMEAAFRLHQSCAWAVTDRWASLSNVS